MLPVVGWPKIVTASPVWIFCASAESLPSDQVELPEPLAGQKKFPSGVSVLVLPAPGRMAGSVFQVMPFSLQLLLPSRSNSKPPAAMRLKLPLPGCCRRWPRWKTASASRK